MDERTMQFRVGVMVLATLLIAGLLVVLFGKMPSILEDTYTVYIIFDDAPGIQRDSPIRKSGILIGHVAGVELKDDAGALVTAHIDADRVLQQNDRARIGGSLIGGDSEIRFVRVARPELSTEPLRPGETIVGEVSADPLQVMAALQSDLAQTLTSFAQAGDDVGRLARRADRLVASNEDQIARIIDRAERTLEGLEAATSLTNELLGDPEFRQGLKEALVELPAVLRETHESLSGVKETVALAQRNLTNLEGFTEPLGQHGEQLVAKIDLGVTRLNYVLEELGAFGQALNESEGSLNQFLTNPDLYHNLNSAAENVDQLTRRLRPIVEDLRVISDKVARNPGSPLRDAVMPGPGIK